MLPGSNSSLRPVLALSAPGNCHRAGKRGANKNNPPASGKARLKSAIAWPNKATFNFCAPCCTPSKLQSTSKAATAANKLAASPFACRPASPKASSSNKPDPPIFLRSFASNKRNAASNHTKLVAASNQPAEPAIS